MRGPWTRWPEDLRPERSPVYSVNELAIDAPPEAVWEALVHAESWPGFYGNARDVRVEGPTAPRLGPGVFFTWRTFGLRVRTRVEVFEPASALAWRGDEPYGRGMHTWRIERTPRGCRVVTEEVQAGPLPWIARAYIRRGLLRWHQRWLEGLATRARGSTPAPD